MNLRITAILIAAIMILNLTGCTLSKKPDNSDKEKYSLNVKFPVTATMSAEESALRINNKTEGAIKKLKTESVRISRYDSAWAFAHHGFITEFNGCLYAMWSSGHEHEDDLGQRVMYAKSENFTDWSIPEALADSMQGISSENVLFPMGFYVNGDTLIAYYKRCEYDYTKLRNEGTLRPDSDTGWMYTKYYYITSKDGENWSEPTEFHIRQAGVSQARQNKTGRLIWAGGTGIAYSDLLDGIKGWTTTEIKTQDIEAAYENGASLLCEASWYQTDDGIMHLLMRSNSGYMWHSESYDNGESWSGAYPTQFTDDNTMAYIGNLPDGRYYYVGSPIYSGSDARTPLMLYISKDGYNWSEQYVLCDTDYEMKRGGFAKCGGYGYPECVVADGYVYIVYSLGKEIMEVTRFKISDLDEETAKSDIIKPNAPAWSCDFSAADSCALIKAEGDTSVSFDSEIKALKVEVTGNNSPATVLIEGLEDKNISFKDYPVVAMRVKKSGYKKLNTGGMHFLAGNKENWMQFKSPKYNYQSDEDEEWVTIAIDLSSPQSYYDAAYKDYNISRLEGSWKGLKLGLAYKELVNGGETFYVESIGLFKTVYDAQMSLK